MRWSKNLAYAVGLITTDGCLSKDGRHIDFTSRDLEQIKTFLVIIGSNAKIGLKSSGYSSKKYFYTQFSNVKLYRFCLKIGLTPAKSKTLGVLKIPNRFFGHFLRGCLDGDGHTHSYFDPRWKDSFQLYTSFASASKIFIEWLCSKIEELYGIKGVIHSRSRVFSLEFAKKNSILILKKMYPRQTVPCLQRKRSKIMTALAIIHR